MDVPALFAILGVFIASCESFRLDSIKANINDDRIVGGETARPGQFPFMVSLRSREQLNNSVIWEHMCGGSILSNRWVISAAHCTEHEYSNTSKVAIAVGAHHIQKDGEIYRLEQIINHPALNRTNYNNDISLLQTKEPIQYNNFVKPIPLRRQFVGADVASIVSGWGYSGRRWFPGSSRRRTHLQYVGVNTLTNEECRMRHNEQSHFRFYEGTLCAFARKGHGVCFGDSGGPLTADGQLIGLVGWARPCARGVPDGYLRVSVFLNWIQEVSGVTAV